MRTKKITLLVQQGKKTQELSFDKPELILGSSQVADIKLTSKGIPSVFCSIVLEDKQLIIKPIDGKTENFLLAVGESFSIDDKGTCRVTFKSLTSVPELKLIKTEKTAEDTLEAADEMLNAESELPDIEAEASSYINSVKTAEARLNRLSNEADFQFKSKLSQSSAKAHRILEQTSRDIAALTEQAQKKVHYLNHEISEKSEQLNNTIQFLEEQVTLKNEELELIVKEIDDLEYKKVALTKDIRVKESEFDSLQNEYNSLISERKHELVHLTENVNKTKNQLNEVKEGLMLEERRFDEKTFILQKNINNLEGNLKDKEGLLVVLKENCRNLEEDIQNLNHEKEKITLKINEEEGLLNVLSKKKDLVHSETQRIIERSKEESQEITRAAELKSEELKKNAALIKESAQKEAEEILLTAKTKAHRLTEESREGSKKLVEVAKADAKQFFTSAESDKEQTRLECEKKIKEAELERERIIQEAMEKRDSILREVESKRQEQLEYFDRELEKFKNGLQEKSKSHLKLVSSQVPEKKSTFSMLSELITPDKNKSVAAEEVKTKIEEPAHHEEKAAPEKSVENDVIEAVNQFDSENETQNSHKAEESPAPPQETEEHSEPAVEMKTPEEKQTAEEEVKEPVVEAAAAEEPEAATEEAVEAPHEENKEASSSDEKELEAFKPVAKAKNEEKKKVNGAAFFSKKILIGLPTAAALMLGVYFAFEDYKKWEPMQEVALDKKEEPKQEVVVEEEKVAERAVSSLATSKAADVYHKSYTERVLYTEDYMKNEFKSSYRSKWINEIKKFVVEKAKFSESNLAPIITTETALLRALDQMQKRSKNTDLMSKLEEQLLKKLRKQLKTDELYDEFFKLKASFYKQEYSVK